MKVPFIYYLHDDGNRWETAEYIHSQIVGLTDTTMEDILELVDHPFYEVTLACEFDTETGEVTLVSATL